MEATVAERGQITLPKAVRDALGLTKGTQLKVELDGGRIILRKNVDDALSRLRGRFKLRRGLRQHRRGDARAARPRAGRSVPASGRRGQASDEMIAVDSSVLVDVLGRRPALRRRLGGEPGPRRWRAGDVVVCDAVVAEIARPCSTAPSVDDGEAGLARHPLPADERAGRRARRPHAAALPRPRRPARARGRRFPDRRACAAAVRAASSPATPASSATTSRA